MGFTLSLICVVIMFGLVVAGIVWWDKHAPTKEEIDEHEEDYPA